MNFIDLIIANKLDEAKENLLSRLSEITRQRLQEAKNYVTEELFDEAKRNTNIIKMGRITKIRRRVRRNAKRTNHCPKEY